MRAGVGPVGAASPVGCSPLRPQHQARSRQTAMRAVDNGAYQPARWRVMARPPEFRGAALRVSFRLLIRRSLVRVQVGEPSNLRGCVAEARPLFHSRADSPRVPGSRSERRESPISEGAPCEVRPRFHSRRPSGYVRRLRPHRSASGSRSVDLQVPRATAVTCLETFPLPR